MTNNIITMPDVGQFSFDECLDNLQNTRDYILYLKTLSALKARYLIILSVKDTSAKASDEVYKLVRELGFSGITNDHLRAYIGIINRGEVIFNESASAIKKPLETSQNVSDVSLYVLSEPRGKGNSQIVINDVDHSMNSRGLNIVVYDFETETVIDSSTYDCWLENPEFFHKLPWFDEQYINEHFYLRDNYKKQWVNYYQRSFSSNRKLSYREIVNGIVEPVVFNKNGNGCGGCCDENFNFVAGHVKMKPNHRNCSESYIPDCDIEYIDETVIYVGHMYDHPGHLIAEHIAEFMWWLVQYNNSDYKIALTYLRWADNPNDMKFIKELFESYSIPFSRVIVVKKPVQFSKIIVPDPASICEIGVNGYEYTTKFKESIDYIKSLIMPAEYKKIYLTRRKAVKGNCIGEGFFIDFYKKKGFEIINPEDYTLKEKAALMLGADEVVSTIGTNSLFSIFCKSNVKLTILSRVNALGSKVQGMINQIAGIKDVTIIDVSANFLHNDMVWGLYLLCVTNQFRDYVKKTYNEELDITPEESLKSMVFEYLEYFIEYYSTPKYFNMLKNQKMLTILQHMSEIFLNKDLDTSNLNTKTDEDMLKEQVKKLTAELESAKKRIKVLEGGEAYEASKIIASTTDRLESQIEELHKLCKEKKDHNADEVELKKKIKKLENKVKSYEQSTSWKITKPLRAILGFFRKLFKKGNK